jgi:hypothetical protein
MSELTPVYRIENIPARQKFGKIARRFVIKQTAEEPALLGCYRRKTNPPAGMNQRADRKIYVALSERQSLFR